MSPLSCLICVLWILAVRTGTLRHRVRWCTRAQLPPAEDTVYHLGLAVTQCPTILLNIQLDVPSADSAYTAPGKGRQQKAHLGGISRDSLGGKGQGSLRLSAHITAMDRLLWGTCVLCLLNLLEVVSSQLRPPLVSPAGWWQTVAGDLLSLLATSFT